MDTPKFCNWDSDVKTVNLADVTIGLQNKTVWREVFESSLAFDEHRVGAAAVYCSDGRFGQQMDEFLYHGLKLPRYDRVAVPGGCACLAGHTQAYYEKNAMERQLRFLMDEHKLRRVVLIAHDSCAFYKEIWIGSRSVEEQQAIDAGKAAETIRLWHPDVEIETYFARKVDGKVIFEKWG